MMTDVDYPSLDDVKRRVIAAVCTLDFIKVYLDFRKTSCVLTEFGSYAARNMFP